MEKAGFFAELTGCDVQHTDQNLSGAVQALRETDGKRGRDHLQPMEGGNRNHGLTMRDVSERGEKACTQLGLVLKMHGAFRRSLEPIRVTPLQAGVILFLLRHEDPTLKDGVAAFLVRSSTLSVVVDDLVRKRWVIKRRAHHDGRAVCLRLSQQGERLAVRIIHHIRDVKQTLSRRSR